jgi:hypothetical protein
MGSLALRPDDLLTILTMALSIGFRNSVSFLSAIQATGLPTFTPVGLPPTEHASLHWTHSSAYLLPSPMSLWRVRFVRLQLASGLLHFIDGALRFCRPPTAAASPMRRLDRAKALGSNPSAGLRQPTALTGIVADPERESGNRRSRNRFNLAVILPSAPGSRTLPIK